MKLLFDQMFGLLRTPSTGMKPLLLSRHETEDPEQYFHKVILEVDIGAEIKSYIGAISFPLNYNRDYKLPKFIQSEDLDEVLSFLRIEDFDPAAATGANWLDADAKARGLKRLYRADPAEVERQRSVLDKLKSDIGVLGEQLDAMQSRNESIESAMEQRQSRNREILTRKNAEIRRVSELNSKMVKMLQAQKAFLGEVDKRRTAEAEDRDKKQFELELKSEAYSRLLEMADSKLGEHQKKIADLEETLAAQKADAERLKSERDKCDSENEALIEVAEKLETENQAIAGEVEIMIVSVTELENRLSEKEALLKKADEDSETQKQRLGELATEMATEKEKRAACQEQTEQAKLSLAHAEKSLMETQSECENMNADPKLKAKVKSMEAEREEEKAKFKRVLDFEHSRLEQIRILIMLKEKAEEKLMTATEQLAGMKGLLEIMEKEKSDAKQAALDSEATCEAERNQLEETRLRVDELKAEVDQEQARAKEQRDKAAQLEQEKKRHEDELGRVRTQLETAEAKWKVAQSEVQNLRKKADGAEGSQAAAESGSAAGQGPDQAKACPSEAEIEQMNELLTIFEAELKNETEKLAKSERELDESKSVIALLQGELAKCGLGEADECLIPNSEAESILEEVEKQGQEREALAESGRQKDAQISELESALNLVLLENERKEKALGSEESEKGANSLRKEVAQKKQEEAQLAKQSGSLEESIAALEKERDALSESISGIKKTISENEKIKTQLEANNQINLGEFEKLKQIGLDVQNKAVVANEVYKNLITQFQSLKQTVIERRNQQTQIDKNTEILKGRYEELKAMEERVIKGLKGRMSKQELYEALVSQKQELIAMAKALKKPEQKEEEPVEVEAPKVEPQAPVETLIPVPKVQGLSPAIPSSPLSMLDSVGNSKESGIWSNRLEAGGQSAIDSLKKQLASITSSIEEKTANAK